MQGFNGIEKQKLESGKERHLLSWKFPEIRLRVPGVPGRQDVFPGGSIGTGVWKEDFIPLLLLSARGGYESRPFRYPCGDFRSFFFCS